MAFWQKGLRISLLGSRKEHDTPPRTGMGPEGSLSFDSLPHCNLARTHNLLASQYANMETKCLHLKKQVPNMGTKNFMGFRMGLRVPYSPGPRAPPGHFSHFSMFFGCTHLTGQLIAIGQVSGKRYRVKNYYRDFVKIGQVCERSRAGVDQHRLPQSRKGHGQGARCRTRDQHAQ